ncbi:MAG TPA: ATP-binding protein [Streptosporangiaceae bacterium]|nr:ATP-binding protein [Streptosporangiaceae bacterium]
MNLPSHPGALDGPPGPLPIAAAESPVSVRRWDRLDLAAVATAACCARMFARLTLTNWGASDALEDAQLVVSELVTNAVKASGVVEPRPAWGRLQSLNLLAVSLTGMDASVRIEVWDASPDEPVRRQATPDDEDGRGLEIVARLASRWGSQVHRGGKVVWAELAVGRWNLRQLPDGSKPASSLALSRAVDWSAADHQVLRHVLDGLQAL